MNLRLMACVAVGMAMPTAALADEFPSPYDYVSNLDLECYRSDPVPPPANNVLLRHLNPAMQGLTQNATLYEMRRLCLPVEKDNNTPPPDVLRFIQWTDLACYRAEADLIDVTLDVQHLNPVLAGLPDEKVRIRRLAQVCLPVRKSTGGGGPQIPPDVRPLVENVDVACYEIEDPTHDANQSLTLSHLNPVVQGLNLPDRSTNLRRAFQLCLPVGKDNQAIDADVLNVVQWVDFLRYRLDPVPLVNFNLYLRQMNPLYATQPWFNVNLFTPPRPHLMVPIAKDTSSGGGGIPPNN